MTIIFLKWINPIFDTHIDPVKPSTLSLRQLSVKGYNDKQDILLKKIIEKMATFEIDEKRFDIIKEAVITTVLS